MSDLPTAPRLPRPVGHSKSAPYTSDEHGELLHFVWKNLDLLARLLLPPLTSKEIKKQVAAARTGWQKERADALKIANGMLAARHLPGRHAFFRSSELSVAEHEQAMRVALTDYVKRLEQCSTVPPSPAWAIGPAIDARHLAKPIHQNGFTEGKRVGYIDIEMTAHALREIQLRSNVPGVLRTSARGDPAAQYIGESEFEQAVELKWVQLGEHPTFWVDIRPELPPAGQLLRELKTLLEHAPTREVRVALVTNADSESESMLRHEGFALITRDQLEALGSDLE